MSKRFSQNDFIEMPWKNGAGVTTELFRLPDPQDPSQFLLRISRAKVEQDGPFSVFPGVNRELLILQGDGCRLAFTDRAEVLVPGRVLTFHGEDPIHCQLINGPIVDFNVMIARKFGGVNVSSGEKMEFVASSMTFLYHPKSEILWQFAAGEKVKMEEDQLLIQVSLLN